MKFKHHELDVEAQAKEATELTLYVEVRHKVDELFDMVCEYWMVR